jgi:hypothetical protein
MGAIMNLINFNSYAYMGFMLLIIACIYVILFAVVKVNLKKE